MYFQPVADCSLDIVIIKPVNFYHSFACEASSCYSNFSVCPSVCPSVSQ